MREDQDKITALNFNDFNLSNRKVYSMLSPYKYLTRTKGNNSKIIPQSWTHNPARQRRMEDAQDYFHISIERRRGWRDR
jgi:hypothetical protein